MDAKSVSMLLTVFVNMLSFTGYELRAIGAVTLSATRGTPLEILRTRRSLNICSVAKIHRGSTAGVNNFRPIQIIITRNRQFPKVSLPSVNDARISALVTLQHDNKRATQARIISRFEDPSRTVCRQRNIDADVATVTASPFVPHNTQYEHELSVLLLNSRPVLGKAFLVSDHTIDTAADFAILTETWL